MLLAAFQMSAADHRRLRVCNFPVGFLLFLLFVHVTASFAGSMPLALVDKQHKYSKIKEKKGGIGCNIAILREIKSQNWVLV